MLKRILSRVVVPILACVGAVTLIALAAAGIRGRARDTMKIYACEWRLLDAATCYSNTPSSGFYDEAIDEITGRDELEKELAPIIAEQERLKADRRKWDKNSRSIDLDLQKAFIIGCERDKLFQLQDGKDVSSWDCRKNSRLR